MDKFVKKEELISIFNYIYKFLKFIIKNFKIVNNK